MHRRLRQLRDLQCVQSMERDLARRDHAEASARAEAAREEAHHGAKRVDAAAGLWFSARDGKFFDPQRGEAFAMALVTAQAAATELAAQEAVAQAERTRIEDRCRQMEAHRRAIDRIVGELRRDIARAEEEAMLDIVTLRTLHERRA